MANIKLIDEAEAIEPVVAIYNDIKKTFGMDFVPGLFRAMANNPAYLEASWNRYKVIMGAGKLDRKTKEMIAVAVSATNGCEYCINAHTTVLKKMGLGDAEITELMAVVDLFSGFNKLLDGLRVESDIFP
ncbi:MAG: carboxymuconolactone decarboxylase family protein [Methylobacter sp.]|uniref:Carboxymuconolactone decarboxylase family protein n=1 Tax=Candidatus Methylobacter titanis TaxID=3053457 RepID=A0AA43Q515_9GAMM|nr:carboxymuconolactone decarboxylase family protein [Candidatus Methylobacter titanis]